MEPTSFETPPRDSEKVDSADYCYTAHHHEHNDMIAHSASFVLRLRRSPSCRTISNTEIDGDDHDCCCPAQYCRVRTVSYRGSGVLGNERHNSRITERSKRRSAYRHLPRSSAGGRRRHDDDEGVDRAGTVFFVDDASKRFRPPALSTADESLSFMSREHVHEAAYSKRGILLPLSLQGANDEDDDSGSHHHHRHHHRGYSCLLEHRPAHREFLKLRRSPLPRDLQRDEHCF
jgi:hypothetical protein